MLRILMTWKKCLLTTIFILNKCKAENTEQYYHELKDIKNKYKY